MAPRVGGPAQFEERVEHQSLLTNPASVPPGLAPQSLGDGLERGHHFGSAIGSSADVHAERAGRIGPVANEPFVVNLSIARLVVLARRGDHALTFAARHGQRFMLRRLQ
ncbi:MAG TPA: hypothetical protein VMY88_09200 [Acidimicrobiales bacterium]|nr:hypothetical protein [Acidimicrobiales bacterium]